jgi:hypothetical protein
MTERSFWDLASFRLSHRVAWNLLLRRSLAKSQKPSLRAAILFFKMLYPIQILTIKNGGHLAAVFVLK